MVLDGFKGAISVQMVPLQFLFNRVTKLHVSCYRGVHFINCTMASFHVILIFLLGVTQALHTLSSRADPILNIQKIAFSLKKDDSTIEYGFYGIFVKFSEDSQKIFARDEHVAGLALKAYEEAKAVKEEEEKPTNEQLGLAGMAVLLVGDEAYFASPMRRIWTTDLSNSKDVPQYFMYDVLGGNVPLRQQLLQCRLQVVNDTPNEKSKPRIKPQHNNNGNCGEIVAMQVITTAET